VDIYAIMNNMIINTSDVFLKRVGFMINGIALNQGITNAYGNSYNSGYSKNVGNAENKEKPGQVSKTECQTCKSRKYIDGSNESNVSFKTPGHIAPSASAALVSAHERQHVGNAINEGSQKGNKLLSVSVSLKTSVCPECGRVYVSGGETRTVMKKSLEEETKLNPYNEGEELVKRFLMQGMNIDLVA